MQQYFVPYIQGKLRVEEESLFLNWIEESDTNKQEFLQFRKTWDMLVLTQPCLTENSQPKPLKKLNWGKTLLKAASVLLFMGCLCWFTYQHYYSGRPNVQVAYNTIEVPEGQRVLVTLSDGSEVWLNSCSKLVYPSSFNDTARLVSLEGEGLFKVTKDAARPFSVRTSAYTVQVHGTTFNVYAYLGTSQFETTLLEGAVSIQSNTDNAVHLNLAPNQRAVYTTAKNKLLLENVDAADYADWTSGVYGFNDLPFNELLSRLENYYNATIKVDECAQHLLSYKCTGKFRQHQTLKYVLNVIKTDIPFQFTINEDTAEVVISCKQNIKSTK